MLKPISQILAKITLELFIDEKLVKVIDLSKIKI